MLTVDFIGLIFTIIITGLRYPQYVILGTVIHEFGRIIMVLFLHGNIDSVIAAGIFSATAANNLKSSSMNLLIIFSGPLANYIVSSTTSGIEFEKTAHLFNPFAKLQHPFAVINLRLAIISLLINIKELF
jgi:uncharacterized membrane protein (DUF106 family)